MENRRIGATVAQATVVAGTTKLVDEPNLQHSVSGILCRLSLLWISMIPSALMLCWVSILSPVMATHKSPWPPVRIFSNQARPATARTFHTYRRIGCKGLTTAVVGCIVTEMNRYERHLAKERRAQIEAELKDAYELSLKKTPTSAGVWKTVGGRVIRIVDMKDDHLMNAIKRCVTRGYRLSKVGFLKIEARRRGLM